MGNLKYIIIFFIGLIVGYINGIIEQTLFEKKTLSGQWGVYFRKGILIQIATGLVFLLLFAKYGLTWDFVFFAYLLSILIIIFSIDIKTKTIPNPLTIAGLAGGLLSFTYNLFFPLKIYDTDKWWEPLVGILPGAGFLILIIILGIIIYKSDEVMGMGDVKVFLFVGIFLGWKMCIMALLISMLLGGVASILFILFKIKGRKDTIPFGPFIVIATLVTIVWGKDLWIWYSSLL